MPNKQTIANIEDEESCFEEEETDNVYKDFAEQSPNGRFKRFDDELGRGAYKTVYRGVDHDTGREVAWSIISIGRLPKSERPRIKSEIKLIKRRPRTYKHCLSLTNIKSRLCCTKPRMHSSSRSRWVLANETKRPTSKKGQRLSREGDSR